MKKSTRKPISPFGGSSVSKAVKFTMENLGAFKFTFFTNNLAEYPLVYYRPHGELDFYQKHAVKMNNSALRY